VQEYTILKKIKPLGSKTCVSGSESIKPFAAEGKLDDNALNMMKEKQNVKKMLR